MCLIPSLIQTFQYWPKGGCVQHGDITVEVEIETSEHSYLHRKIKLTNAKVVSKKCVTPLELYCDTVIFLKDS